jgi:carbon starvation protein
MNSAVVVIAGGLVIFLAYRFYAKRIDERVIQPDPRAMTPAQAFEDGVDFVPTSRYVLYGYHFKSVAAAGPIVGVITAASIWGWVPSILWLMLGVTFIGWASDYSAIILSVRNEGHSLSGVAYRLINPRTRTILYVFIFFYLLLIGGAFIGIMSAVMDARPDAPFGILMLALMGMLGGYLLYRTRVSIGRVTVLVVGVTLLAMALGPVGVGAELEWEEGPISGVVQSINQTVNEAGTLYTLVDPTGADPRIPPPDPETGERPTTPRFDAETGRIQVLPSFLLWAVFILAFCFLGARLAIWQFAQPVNYIGFWVTALVIGLGAIGAVLAVFTHPDVASFEISAIAEGGGFAWFWPETPTAAIQPLWPMLFVTIACGAISGWHALFGSVGTSRQIEYETDALPVGGGGMFSENTLALLSLIAVGITGAAGAGGFAAGVGELLNVATLGLLEVPYGTALGFGAFILIVLTVTQLVFRLMRVTLAEWGGERSAAFRNPSSATLLSMVAVLALVLTGTWVYLWQLFGAANQLMAALSLLLVTVWLKSVGRDWRYAGYPMLFMYVTTVAASLVTSYNLFSTIVLDPATELPEQVGATAMILIALLLVVAALIIARDAWEAWQRFGREPVVADEEVRQP